MALHLPSTLRLEFWFIVGYSIQVARIFSFTLETYIVDFRDVSCLSFRSRCCMLFIARIFTSARLTQAFRSA